MTARQRSAKSHPADPARDDSADLFSAQLDAFARRAHPALMIGCRSVTPGDAGSRCRFQAPRCRCAAQADRAELSLLSCSPDSACWLRAAADSDRCAALAAGIVGSISHDANVAVAVVAPSREFASIGIDIEPAQPLPFDLFAW